MNLPEDFLFSSPSLYYYTSNMVALAKRTGLSPLLYGLAALPIACPCNANVSANAEAVAIKEYHYTTRISSLQPRYWLHLALQIFSLH